MAKAKVHIFEGQFKGNKVGYKEIIRGTVRPAKTPVQVLVYSRDGHYDPDKDIKYDWQQMLQLCDRGTDRSIKLRDEIRKYFRNRNEDSIDV